MIFFGMGVNGQTPFPTIEEDYATWYQWPASQGGNDHWYGLVRVAMPGENAETAAQNWGGQLANYADFAERDFLRYVASFRYFNQPYWIALVAKPGETFKWTDGAPVNTNLTPFNNLTNAGPVTNRMAFTPSGDQQFFMETAYSASLFELSANPSALSAALADVRVSSWEESFQGSAIVANGPVKVASPGSARFIARAFGPGPIRYQWKVGGVPVNLATNSEFVLQVSTANTGAVSVAVSNINGGQESDPVGIQVVPVVTTGNPNTFWKQWTKTLGGNDHWYGIRQVNLTYAQAMAFATGVGAQLVTLQTRAEKDGFLGLMTWHLFECWLGVTETSPGSFVWLDGSPVTDITWAFGQPDPAKTNATAIGMDRNGLWSLAYPEDAIGYAAMERTNSPAEIPPLILSEIPPVRLYVGATNRIQFDVVGGPPLSYEWRHGSQPLPAQTNAVLQLCPTNILEAGDYILVVSNAYGAATSAPVNVTIFIATPMQLRATRFENYIRLEYEHPDDAENITIQRSSDMVNWFVQDGSSFPGTHQFADPMDRSSPRVFYRLRRSP